MHIATSHAVHVVTNTGGAAALRKVWKAPHTQEHAHEDEGLSLLSVFAMRHRPLRGHPVVRNANTLTRATMRCLKRASLLKAPLALLFQIPKSMLAPHALSHFTHFQCSQHSSRIIASNFTSRRFVHIANKQFPRSAVSVRE